MNRFTIFIIIIFFFSAGIVSGSESSVTFYKVPLVCGAAPDIGCGSRAKPVLLEMENNEMIKEAWLNREGTVYAIVWKENEKIDIAKTIFEKHGIEYTKLINEEIKQQFATFRQEGKWLRGADVDRLSIEEAGRIAESATEFLVDEREITQTEAAAIKTDIETYFKSELVKIRTLDELRHDSEFTFPEAIIGIYKNHLGQERTMKLVEIYKEKLNKQKDGAMDCCESDCCKK